MMPGSDRVVATARAWIGTPYRHRASCRSHGADCLGLIRGVWRELMGAEPEELPAYTSDWMEPQHDEALWRAAARHLRPLELEDPVCEGSILLFRMRDGAVAKHLGIAATARGATSFIHAYEGHGVVESALTQPWARRVVARFAFPGEPD